MKNELKKVGEGTTERQDWTVPEDITNEMRSLISEAKDIISQADPLLLFGKTGVKEGTVSEDQIREFEERIARIKRELSLWEEELEVYSSGPFYLTLKTILKKWRGEKDLSKEERRFIDNLGKKLSGYGTIPATLTSNIARPKDPSLFDEQLVPKEKREELLYQRGTRKYIDRAGKPTYLTGTQTKIVCAIAHLVSQDLPYIQDEIKEITLAKDRLRKGGNPGIGLGFKKLINLKKLCKEYISTEGKAKSSKVKDLYREIVEISQINQVFHFPNPDKNSQKKNLRLTAPFFTLGEGLEYEDGEEGWVPDQIWLNLSYIFLWDAENAYFPIKKSFFLEWRKRGSGTETELFNILLSDLMAKYPYKRMTAKNKTRLIDKTGLSEEDIQKERERAREDGLKYTQNLSTLRDKIPTDYESKRQYKSLFYKHLDLALQAIRDKLGLITGWEIGPNREGNLALSVFFNSDYENEVKRG